MRILLAVCLVLITLAVVSLAVEHYIDWHDRREQCEHRYFPDSSC